MDSTKKQFYLRRSIKILLIIGFLFLLVPFVSSVLRDTAGSSDPLEDGVLLRSADLPEGNTISVSLPDGHTVFVTHISPKIQQELTAIPREHFWSYIPVEMLDRSWLVVSSTNALNEALHFKQADDGWPGGFISDSGYAWDLAGRALKPDSHLIVTNARNSQNLTSAPFKRKGDAIVLKPFPDIPDTPASQEAP